MICACLIPILYLIRSSFRRSQHLLKTLGSHLSIKSLAYRKVWGIQAIQVKSTTTFKPVEPSFSKMCIALVNMLEWWVFRSGTLDARSEIVVTRSTLIHPPSGRRYKDMHQTH